MISTSKFAVELVLGIARDIDLTIKVLLQGPERRDQTGRGNRTDNHQIDVTVRVFVARRLELDPKPLAAMI